jgi:hypothetical protein
MRRRRGSAQRGWAAPAVVAVALATLALSLSAHAQDQQLVHRMLGRQTYQLVLPAGWAAEADNQLAARTETNQAIEIMPSRSARVQASFRCRIVTVARPAGTTTALAVARALVDADREDGLTDWSATEPDALSFADLPGALIWLHGKDSKGERRAIRYLVAVSTTDIYFMKTQGSLRDLERLAHDLDAIAAGFREIEVQGGGIGIGRTPANDAGVDRPPGPAPAAAAAAAPLLRDPSWGLTVGALPDTWQLAYVPGAYQLRISKSGALVHLSWIDAGSQARFERKLLRGKGARRSLWAGRDAIVVDTQPKQAARRRDIYVWQGGGAVHISATSFGFDTMTRKHLPALEAALTFRTPAVVSKPSGGIRAELLGGVTVDTDAGWTLRARAGRSLELGRRKSDVVVALEAFAMDREQAWAEVPSRTRQDCKRHDGTLQESELSGLPGARRTVRYQCSFAGFTDVITLAESQSPTSGPPIFLRTIAFHARGKPGPPLAETDEILGFVHLAADAPLP